MTDLEKFKSLVGKLHAIIDGDIPSTSPEASNESLMNLIGEAGKLGDILMSNLKEIPCSERTIVILSHGFLKGLAHHILKEVSKK